MIHLTRLNRVPIVVNSDLIQHIEATPDTVIALIRSCDQTSRNGEESKSSRHRPTRVSAGGAEIAATHPWQGRHAEHNGQRIAGWPALTGSALCQAGPPEFLLV